MIIVREDLPLLFKIKDVADDVLGIASVSDETMIIVWNNNGEMHSDLYQVQTVLHKLNTNDWTIVEGGRVI